MATGWSFAARGRSRLRRTLSGPHPRAQAPWKVAACKCASKIRDSGLPAGGYFAHCSRVVSYHVLREQGCLACVMTTVLQITSVCCQLGHRSALLYPSRHFLLPLMKQ